MDGGIILWFWGTQKVSSCVMKHLFLKRVQHPNFSGNALSDAIPMSHYQNFAAGAAKNTALRADLNTPLIAE